VRGDWLHTTPEQGEGLMFRGVWLSCPAGGAAVPAGWVFHCGGAWWAFPGFCLVHRHGCTVAVPGAPSTAGAQACNRRGGAVTPVLLPSAVPGAAQQTPDTAAALHSMLYCWAVSPDGWQRKHSY